MGGRIAKVVLDDGRVFRVGITRPIKHGENYLHFRHVENVYSGDKLVFGVDTWMGEEDTPFPGLVLIEEGRE